MQSLSTLVVSIKGNSAHLQREYKKASANGRSFATQVKSSAKVGAVAIVAMGAASAGAIAAMYKEQAQYNDTLAKSADKLGVTTQALEGMRHVAQLTGNSTQVLDKGLLDLNIKVQDAAKGIGEGKEALSALNLSAEKLARLSPDQQFLKVSEALKGIPDQGKKVAIAYDLFGARGAGLVNTMNLGATAIKSSMEEAEKLGATLNRIDAAKIEAANDSMFKVEQSTKGLKNAIAVGLAPIVEDLGNRFYQSALDSGGWGEATDKAINAVIKGVGFAADAIRGLKVVWKGVQLVTAIVMQATFRELAKFDVTISAILNKIPGVNAKTSQFLQGMTKGFDSQVVKLKKELHALATEKLPSKAIEEWKANIDRASQKKAEIVSFNSPAMQVPKQAANDEDVSGDDVSTAKLDSELAQLDNLLLSKEERQRAHWERMYAINDEALAAEKITKAEHTEHLIGLDKKVQDEQVLQAQQRQQLVFSASQKIFGGLAGIAKTFAGKSSKTYKAMFAVSKAFAIAQGVMNLSTAISNAAALPWPANIPAMAAAAATGASLVASIKGTQMKGQAHDGISRVPAGNEGTWMLRKDEMVLNPTQRDNFEYLVTNMKQANPTQSANEPFVFEFKPQVNALDQANVAQWWEGQQEVVYDLVVNAKNDRGQDF